MRDSASGHRFDPSILREYDIRGIVGQTLHDADAGAIGQSFAAVVQSGGGRTVAVGRDGRLSSPALEAALVAGLAGAGIDVVRVGLGPTPMLYFAAHTLGVDAGIMVTGSHNPPDHNGFKIMLGKRPFFADDIQRLGRIAAAGNFPTGAGRVSEDAVARGLRCAHREGLPRRAAADRRLGCGQWRRGRCAEAADGTASGPPHFAQRSHRRDFSRPSSRSDRGHEPGAASRGGAPGRLRPRHRFRRRRRPSSASSTVGGGSCGATS